MQVAADHADVTLADYFAEQLGPSIKTNDVVALGPIALLAHSIADGRVATVGLKLIEDTTPADVVGRAKAWLKRLENLLD